MADVLIVGDGPAGLSAALFLAKNEMSVKVFGKDETLMHKAMLYNYLGIPKMTGGEFQKIAREQVTGFGVEILDEEVATVEKTDSGFALTTQAGECHEGEYLILAAGPQGDLANSLVAERDFGGIVVDRNGRTSVQGLYVVGWTTRMKKIQAIISAGDGATAALDILSDKAGEDIHDFDVVEEDE